MAFRYRVPSLSASRLALGILAVTALLAAFPGTVRAVEPIDLRDVDRAPAAPEGGRSVLDGLRDLPLGPEEEPRTPSPAPTAAPPGFDLSYPQCGDAYPESFSFAIVGVNGGKVLSVNPCLGPGRHPSQLEWAGRDAGLYANTGNPGPRLSRFWPHGQAEPRACNTDDAPGADTLSCAYDYGWNAARHAYRTALEAFIDLGWAHADARRIPGNPTWWLDVEDANSWRRYAALNVAALQGAVASLESLGVQDIGFYSTPRMWARITGGTDAFADHPAWHAGARDASNARDRCDVRSFTGGELRMVQWVEDGLDHNYRCP